MIQSRVSFLHIHLLSLLFTLTAAQTPTCLRPEPVLVPPFQDCFEQFAYIRDISKLSGERDVIFSRSQQQRPGVAAVTLPHVYYQPTKPSGDRNKCAVTLQIHPPLAEDKFPLTVIAEAGVDVAEACLRGTRKKKPTVGKTLAGRKKLVTVALLHADNLNENESQAETWVLNSDLGGIDGIANATGAAYINQEPAVTERQLRRVWRDGS